MVESENIADPQLVECEICLTEVPVSGAASEETSDYVFYFCGIDCYAQWKEKARQETNISVEK